MARKSICIICPYPLDTVPGQRLKYEQYLHAISDNGYDITVAPFFTNKEFSILYTRRSYHLKSIAFIKGVFRRIKLLFSLPRYNGIYIFLNVVPLGPPLLDFLYIHYSKASIFDIDDMVHLSPSSSFNPLVALFKSKSRYYMLMAKSNYVITCTPYLFELASRFNPKVIDISSTVDTSRYLPVNKYVNSRPLTIGWSGSHSTVEYLHLLDEVFKELAREIPFKLLVLGADRFTLPGVDVEVRPWTSSSEISNLQDIDIGVYPLPDSPWILGKSGLKAIQYMALGIPTVASNLGCNSRVIQHSSSGYLVDDNDQWLSTLKMLMLSPDLRRNIGSAARKSIVERFSLQACLPSYLSVFNEVFC